MTQVVAAIAAAAVLLVIANGRPDYSRAVNGLAVNGYGSHSPGHYSLLACLVIEVVLTAFFLLVILGATDRRAPKGFGPLAIGLSLTLIHLVSIPVTNTSVNPARSTGPALLVGEGWAVGQLWLFWLAPLVGAAIAGLGYRFITGDTGVEDLAETAQEPIPGQPAIGEVQAPIPGQPVIGEVGDALDSSPHPTKPQPLPRRLHRPRVVVLAHPRDRFRRRDAIEDRECGQRRSGATDPAPAGDLHALTGTRAPVRLVQRIQRVGAVQRHPEVRPADAPMRPRRTRPSASSKRSPPGSPHRRSACHAPGPHWAARPARSRPATCRRSPAPTRTRRPAPRRRLAAGCAGGSAACPRSARSAPPTPARSRPAARPASARRRPARRSGTAAPA